MNQSKQSLQLERTEDGSLTLYTPTFGEHYHSTHGAVQESQHIYLGLGLEARLQALTDRDEPLRLFEVGFGTGLNALLSFLAAERHQRPIHYYSIERYPLPPEVYSQLDYPLEGLTSSAEQLQSLHRAPWDEAIPLSPYFTLHKLRGDLSSCDFPPALDLVYYDAFSPEKQPELWAEPLLARLARCCRPGTLLTTYCAKGEVRRRLERSGFSVERLPGPPGKREVLRATKRAAG